MRANKESSEIVSEPFDLAEVVPVLQRTPEVLSALLVDLPEVLVHRNEGEGTWSPYDVVGHLIHGEKTDWIPRLRHIMAGETRPFETFDRNAQFTESGDKSLADLLAEFARLRRDNLATLERLDLGEADLARPGLHPQLGTVDLGQLLATWVVHDLDHIAQVARTLAKRHTTNVGPWTAYLSILNDRR